MWVERQRLSASSIAGEICDLATREQVEHIVMGTRSMNTVGQLVLGSVSRFCDVFPHSLSSEAFCNVLDVLSPL